MGQESQVWARGSKVIVYFTRVQGSRFRVDNL
jgi:hypothetical protein